MSKPRSFTKRSPASSSKEKNTEELSVHDQNAILTRKVASYENVYEMLNQFSPFSDRKSDDPVDGLTDMWSFPKWATFVKNFMFNMFSPTRQFKQNNPSYWIPKLIREQSLFNQIRHMTKVDGLFDVESAFTWVLQTVVSIARRHTVWALETGDNTFDIHNMTAEEWESNAKAVHEALDPEGKFHSINIFFCEIEDAGFVFMSSGFMDKFLRQRLLDEENIMIEVTLTVGGQEYEAFIYNPKLCAFPFASYDDGLIDEMYKEAFK